MSAIGQLDYGADDPIWVDKAWLDTVVVVGITCFVLCLMGLSKVSTSKMGMLYGIGGMIALIVGYWVDSTYTYGDGPWLIAASMAPGAALGLWSAYSVRMTGLPEMIGAYNGFGGLAAALTGIGLYLDPEATLLVRNGDVIVAQTDSMLWVQGVALILSVVIGMMTFTGSMVAVGKLHGWIASRPRVVPFRMWSNLILLAAMLVFGALAFSGGQHWNDRGAGMAFIYMVAFLAGVYGVVAVMAIGGGDMPVSICFLNSLSGFSTSAAGFMLSNKALVIAGAFVGCSGMILTLVMCKAMNRSVVHVLMGDFGEGSNTQKATKADGDDEEKGTVQKVSAEDVVELLTAAKSVIVVPGYGMAVAKAQYAIADLAVRLRARGVLIRFAIHPVAGRMPGHMAVLLAEARVPYNITFSMDDINQDFPRTDVVLILGGNDIVNPAAQTDPSSPIAGMPVLEVWKAKHTIVMKRSLRTGYAGVENPLFFKPNNAMYLGDAKESTEKLMNLLGSVKKGATDSDTVNTDVELPAHQVDKAPVDEFYAKIETLRAAAYLKVGVVKEIEEGECRVAIVPDGAKRLLEAGIMVLVQSGAGDGGDFFDSHYAEVGATVLPSAQAVFDNAKVIVKICEPIVNKRTGKHEIDMLRKGTTLISFVGPRTDYGVKLMNKAVVAGVNLLAIDAIPRISRAQSLDVLSSQAKIAGYYSVIQAANNFQRFMNGEVTSGGSFEAAKVLVVGAGVAGLAAVSTASSMGAIVRAFDTRLETKEQVESLGGSFLALDFSEEDGGDSAGYAKVMSDEFYKKEMELFHKQAHECDIIITTAAIPGRQAPVLIKKDAIDQMKAGSVVIDLAGSSGGNCELTKKGETYMYNSVTIIGSDMTNQAMAWQASTMFSNNMVNLFGILCKEQKFDINMSDAVIRGMTTVLNEEITFPPPESVTNTTAIKPPTRSSNDEASATSPPKKPSIWSNRIFDLAPLSEFVGLVVVGVFFGIVGAYAPVVFTQQLGYFIISSFLGYYLIWDVESALFSPLMSTSNALSGVVILGGILMVSTTRGSPTSVLGCVATAVAAINVFGGFAVSYRMLLMYRRE